MTRDCVYCGNRFKLRYRTTERFCTRSCSYSHYFEYKEFKPIQKIPKRKPIRRVSKKRIIQNKIYTKTRQEFLLLYENKYCPIFKNKLATEIHHKKTRIGSFFLDQKYWLAVSRQGHNYIHDNPKWSYKNGYLISKHK